VGVCGCLSVVTCTLSEDTGCYCVVSCTLSPLYLRERNHVIQYIVGRGAGGGLFGPQNILNALDQRKISCVQHYRALTKVVLLNDTIDLFWTFSIV